MRRLLVALCLLALPLLQAPGIAAQSTTIHVAKVRALFLPGDRLPLNWVTNPLATYPLNGANYGLLFTGTNPPPGIVNGVVQTYNVANNGVAWYDAIDFGDGLSAARARNALVPADGAVVARPATFPKSAQVTLAIDSVSELYTSNTAQVTCVFRVNNVLIVVNAFMNGVDVPAQARALLATGLLTQTYTTYLLSLAR